MLKSSLIDQASAATDDRVYKYLLTICRRLIHTNCGFLSFSFSRSNCGIWVLATSLVKNDCILFYGVNGSANVAC